MSLSDNDEPGDGLLSPRKEKMIAKEKEAITRLLLKSQSISSSSGATSPRVTSPRASEMHSAGFDDIRAALARLQQTSKQAAQMRRIDKTRTIASKDGNMVKVLSERIEQAYAALAQREEDIRLAAQLGSHLLCKVDEGMDAVVKLEEKIREQEQMLEKAKEDKRNLERQEKRTAVAIEELEQQLADANKQLLQTRSMLESLKLDKGVAEDGRISALESQIRELQEQNLKLNADCLKFNKLLKLEKECKEDLQKEINESREKLLQMEALQSTIGQLRRKLVAFDKMRTRNEELDWEHKHMQQQLRELTEENERLNSDIQRGSALLQESQSREFSQFSPAHAALKSPGIERSPSLAEELNMGSSPAESSPLEDKDKAPKKSFFSSLVDRFKTTPPVKEEPINLEDPPEQQRRRSSTMPYLGGDEEVESGMFSDASQDEKSGMAPSRVYGAGATRSTGATGALSASGGGSAAGGAGRESVTSHPLEDDAGRPLNAEDEFGRKFHDANKEFFCLTALAIKLNTGDIFQQVSTVSNKQMYAKALEQKVPFHKYAAFIERELTHAYIERVYNPDEQSSNERTDVDSRQRGVSKTHGRHGSVAASFSELRAAGQALAKSGSHGAYKTRLVPSRKLTYGGGPGGPN